MPRYTYTAKSFEGEEKTGIAEAEDKHELARILHHEGYILISSTGEGEKSKKKKFEINILGMFKGVSLTEKMMFTRNLKVMISSGIPLPRALTILSNITKSKKLKAALIKTQENISKGNNFSDSLAEFPDIFSEIFISMVKIGEEAGTLEEVLKTLTVQMERQHELSSKIKGALMYPAVIVVAMLGIGVMMLIMVVPSLAKTFEDFGLELPITTKVVIGLGTFLAEKWYLALLGLIIFIIFLRIALRTKTGKKVVDTLILKIPILSSIIKKTNSAYTVRTLSSLISAGVPIVRALEVVSGSLGNIHYKKAISEAAEKVKKGGKLSAALKPYQNIYPFIVIQMIEVGEETGETSTILAKLADFFEEEVANATKNLSAIVEPILMLFIGGAVGFFAISMIQPMYSMLGAL